MKTKKVATVLVVLGLIGVTGCASRAADSLNPFSEAPDQELGVRDNSAILEDGGRARLDERARHALEVMGSRERTQAPQPYNPVVRPAEVRLMWVPDHLNRSGDLVPAHYYYLRVLPDRWAVQDSFELEQQLNVGDNGKGGTATPWVAK